MFYLKAQAQALQGGVCLQCSVSGTKPRAYRVECTCLSREEPSYSRAALAKPAFCERQKVLRTPLLLPPAALVGIVFLLGSWGLQTAQMYVTVLNVGAEAFQKCMLHVLFRICGHFPKSAIQQLLVERLSDRALCWQGAPYWLYRVGPECWPLMPSLCNM